MIAEKTEYLKLYKALFDFQNLVPEIEKNCTAKAGTFSYKYADLPNIKRAIKPALEQCKLVVTHSTIEKDKQEYLVTKVIQIECGEFVQSITPVPLNLEPQKKGAWFTYFRRYHLCNLLDIAADEDVDGIHTTKENITITRGNYEGSTKTTNNNTRASTEGNGANTKNGLHDKEPSMQKSTASKGNSGHSSPGDAINFSELAEYRIKIKGRYLDKTLNEIGVPQLESYLTYWKSYMAQNKKVGPEVLELLEYVPAYIESKKLNDNFKSTVN